MLKRLGLLLGLLLAAVPTTRAQDYDAGDVYTPLETTHGERLIVRRAPGFRLGAGVGFSLYDGPDILFGSPGAQNDIWSVRPAIATHASFPLLSNQVRGRVLLSLMNIGAQPGADAGPGQNPFLTNESFLAEGNVLFNLLSYERALALPYVLTGLSVLRADPFGQDDVADDLDRDRTAFLLPFGVGIDVALSPTVSLFGEASYRFSLTNIGETTGLSATSVQSNLLSVGPCEEDPTKPECQEEEQDPCEIDPTKPECTEPPLCEDDPSNPDCVNSRQDDKLFSTRFGSGLLMGGVRFGFGNTSPAGRIPPPRNVMVSSETTIIEQQETEPQPQPQPEPDTEADDTAPAICDLVELNTVYFDPERSEIDGRARVLLDENIDLLLRNSACCLYIDGYTDGSEDGTALAGRRAQAAYDYYLARGVAADRMQIRNRGRAFPSCDKEDPEPGCRRNRRVESVPLDCARLESILDAGY